MTVEEMRERKRELGYSYEQIAEFSGLPLRTVQKVLGGVTKSPRYDTLKALEGVFGDKKEMMLKPSKYEAAGVQEYWLVDPDRRKVIVYDFQGELDVRLYGFTQKVPVGIFRGKCAVDFQKIYESVRFLYEEE